MADRVRQQEVHPWRFKIVYAVLAVVLGATVGGLIVLLGRPSSSSGQQWSTWQPDGSPSEKVRQVADFVGRQYRLQSGNQLVGVVGGPVRVGGVPVTHFALAQGQSQADISVLSADGGIMFQLCGLGRNCAINEGKPSLARQYLLQRESFELSLYAFKYTDADSVVTLLPGKPGSQPTYALFLQKDDFSRELGRPLARTLKLRGENTTRTLTQGEGNLIRALDERHLYTFSFQQAPDGSALLVLASPQA